MTNDSLTPRSTSDGTWIQVSSLEFDKARAWCVPFTTRQVDVGGDFSSGFRLQIQTEDGWIDVGEKHWRDAPHRPDALFLLNPEFV